MAASKGSRRGIHVSQPFLLAVGLLAVTILQCFGISKIYAYQILTVLLTGIAGAYIGFAALGDSWKGVIQEAVGLHLFLGISIYCLNAIMEGNGSVMLAFGYFLHGIWDALHHKGWKLLSVSVVDWYPPFCLYFDWGAAVFILWYFHDFQTHKIF